MKQQPDWLRDVLEPGWREREAAHAAKFLDAIPVRCGCMHGACQSKPEGCMFRQSSEPASKAP